MRYSTFPVTALAAVAVLAAAAPAPFSAMAEQAPAQQAAPAPPKAYKPVAITLPKPVSDPSFDAFRKQLITIAQKKDRAALAPLVAASFFWMAGDQDVADKKQKPVDNLAKAVELDGANAVGWEVISSIANDATAEPDPDRKGVICAPGDPQFDENEAEQLATATQTDPTEWGYPTSAGLEVRQAPQKSAAVIEKLGLHLVRVYPDDSPANAVNADYLRIVTPSGKTGYVLMDSVLPLANDQLCYIKESNAWKIAGVIGGAVQGPQ